MTRSGRLSAMIAALSEGRTLLPDALQDRFGKAAVRDLADLVVAGWPVEGDDATGYAIVRTAQAEHVVMAEDDMNRLQLAAAGLADSDPRAAMALASLLSRFAPVFLPGMDVHSIAATVFDRGQVAAARFLPVLRRAVRQRLRVTLDYADRTGQPSRRLVRPLDVERWSDGWALVAWCEMRDDFRQFRLDRIVAVAPGAPFPWEPERELWTFRLYHRHRD